MRRGLRSSFVALLALALCLGALLVPAQAAGLAVREVYALTNREFYRLADSEVAGGWLGISGHQYRMDIESSGGKLGYKSSKPSVAAVNSTGLITCKNAGTTMITVTDKATKETVRFRLRVLKNQKIGKADPYGFPGGNYVDVRNLDDEIYGVFSGAKKIYLKGSTLYVDMYIINCTNSTVRNVGTQRVYLALPWNDEWDISDFEYVRSWNGKIASIAPWHARSVTIKLGKVDPKSIYLRNAHAYCQGGIVEGSIEYAWDED